MCALMLLENKCISCEKYYSSFNNYCSECYMLENPVFKVYKPEIYDNIKDQEVKKRYLGKFLNKFWEDFSKLTKLSHTIIHSTAISKIMLDKSLQEAFSENNVSLLYLSLNGLGMFKAGMFTAKMIDEYLVTRIYSIKELSQEDKYKITKILGQAVINPWNSNNGLILKDMGNEGKVPNTTKDLFTLWFNNKKKVQEYFGNNIIYKCNCGYNKFLKHCDITKSKKFNYKHDHVDVEVECIDYIMKKMKV
jgi:hypothetical protein